MKLLFNEIGLTSHKKIFQIIFIISYIEQDWEYFFESTHVNSIFRVSYVLVTVRILCVFVLSDGFIEYKEIPGNPMFLGIVALFEILSELSLTELRTPISGHSSTICKLCVSYPHISIHTNTFKITLSFLLP